MNLDWVPADEGFIGNVGVIGTENPTILIGISCESGPKVPRALLLGAAGTRRGPPVATD